MSHFFKFLQLVFGIFLAIGSGLLLGAIVQTPSPMLDAILAVIELVGLITGCTLFANAFGHFMIIVFPEKKLRKE